MDALIKEQEKLEKHVNLEKSIDDIDKIIIQLEAARESIAENPTGASVTLAKLQLPIKTSFEAVNNDMKEVYKGHARYQKALDNKFKDKPIPTTAHDALSAQPHLINRAIAMHLLREGQFSVASQFLSDAQSHHQVPDISSSLPTNPDEALGVDPLKSSDLREAFANMYHILHELRTNHNLLPAIAWARQNTTKLELRGSNLEFELAQLQFIHLFMGGGSPSHPPTTDPAQGRLNALAYARDNFSHFQARYLKQISRLAASMAFAPSLPTSPYSSTFLSPQTYTTVSQAFTREFCSLLGLSAESPLYIASTAGSIALPTLLKLQKVMESKRAEWTTAQELPADIPLPPGYLFHAIFVCPVSKEQTTDENPPMMMPCGHVVAMETLGRMSKGSRFKCPYCPGESRPEEAVKLYM